MPEFNRRFWCLIRPCVNTSMLWTSPAPNLHPGSIFLIFPTPLTWKTLGSALTTHSYHHIYHFILALHILVPLFIARGVFLLGSVGPITTGLGSFNFVFDNLAHFSSFFYNQERFPILSFMGQSPRLIYIWGHSSIT